MSTNNYPINIEANIPFLLPPTISNLNDNVLDYSALSRNPIISVAAWSGINSASKLWLHCRCVKTDGHVETIELANASCVSTLPGTPAYSCELSLQALTKFGKDTAISIILMASNDGTLERKSLDSTQCKIILRRPDSPINPRSMVNYHRWMTDIGSGIGHLKVHDLVILEAHNSGVDQRGASWPADQWAACQDDSFLYQMRHGARALDLRLYTDVNARDPARVHLFKHGGYDANRNASACINSVYEFASHNPGEILILDFHEAVMNGAEPNLTRMISKSGLGARCIPASARNLTIGQIRNRFPGRNVVIAWNYSEPYCWPKVHQTWNGRNFNDGNSIRAHMTDIWSSPPTGRLWSMFAAGYDTLGPKRFGPSLFIWDTFFNGTKSNRYRQPSKGNMINVDFIVGTRVVDRCIQATRDRAHQAELSAPVHLHAVEATTKTLLLKWQRPLDTENVASYKVFRNDQLVTTTTSLQHLLTNLTIDTTYYVHVIANFGTGEGAAAEITVKTEGPPDTIKPTKPHDLRAIIYATQTWLVWASSTDNVGVVCYEIYRNGEFVGTSDHGSGTLQGFICEDIVTPWEFRVRAKDAAGNYADSDLLVGP